MQSAHFFCGARSNIYDVLFCGENFVDFVELILGRSIEKFLYVSLSSDSREFLLVFLVFFLFLFLFLFL